MKTGSSKVYVQYGCGLSAPLGWLNYDASPTLRLQQLPLIGMLIARSKGTTFPTNVLYGDIVRGLPLSNDYCDGLFCSHVLEHLSLHDFRIALANSYKILKRGGIFRCVVPDLEAAAREYISGLERGESGASIRFLDETLLGLNHRPRGIKNLVISFFGNSHHLWMWDRFSLAEELSRVGFVGIRFCEVNDCDDKMFNLVEESSRFSRAVAIECKK